MTTIGWLLTGSLVLLTASVTIAYQNGAARSSCQSLSPAHGHQGQEITSSEPYSIRMEEGRHTYTPGEPITVKITSTGTVFTGLLLQARSVINYRTNKPITERTTGYFAFPHGTTNMRTMDCWTKSDSITQTTPYKDITNVTLTWMPPNRDVGEIIFVATVMRNQHEWYTGLMSYVLRYDAKSTLPPPTSTTLKQLETKRPSDVVFFSGGNVNVMTVWFKFMAVMVASIMVRI
ncbi:hypothetical protein LSH36_28g09085 [Paralvinella palmiformis]|uniref:Reelin domain-containing protein n=1 Tax=Paralvinella palmiformis TaxID=53620 RepID=A0AAD9K9T0_9ANNE|nr:hypothetical protein LSH36_28g09085 [Paralvinella palmiformis]